MATDRTNALIATIDRMYDEGASLPAIVHAVGHDAETIKLIGYRVGLSTRPGGQLAIVAAEAATAAGAPTTRTRSAVLRRLPQWRVHEYSDGTFVAEHTSGDTVSPSLPSYAQAAGWAQSQDATWRPTTTGGKNPMAANANKSTTASKTTTAKATTAKAPAKPRAAAKPKATTAAPKAPAKRTAAAKPKAAGTAKPKAAAKPKATTARKRTNGSTRAARVPAAAVVGAYRLPPLFYDDHVARDLPAGTVVKRNPRAVYVVLTAAELKEMKSDANHYATSMKDAGFDNPGMITSAKATLKALAKGPRKAAK